MVTAVFDAYVLIEAEPGKDHFGYYVISFEFVYAGNPHGQWERGKNDVLTSHSA